MHTGHSQGEHACDRLDPCLNQFPGRHRDDKPRFGESAGPAHVSDSRGSGLKGRYRGNHSTGHCRNRLLSERWSDLLTNIKPLVPLHVKARILGATLLRPLITSARVCLRA